MKPIKLSIEGINSYAQKQTIDFSQLISRGIFGIFGKTGSGKSTILDAITLSLYGNIARGTKEFINSSCEKATVEYEFELGLGKEREVYKVSRRFKKKTSGDKVSSVSDYARLMKKNELGEYDVIDDGAKSVNSSIKEILGLEESDFLKSVVLPQGKFSEFLTLNGKDRRNMLERIFNLEEYGSELSKKLYREKKIVDNNINVLKARISEHSDVNEEMRVETKSKIEELTSLKKEEEKKLKIEKDIYDKYKYLNSLLKEQRENSKVLDDLIKKKPEIDKLENVLNLSDKVKDIIPEIEKFKKSTLEVERLKRDRDDLETKYAKSIDESKQFTKRFNEISLKKDKLVHILSSKKDIERIIELKLEMKSNCNEEDKTSKELEKRKKNLSEIGDKIVKNNEKINSIKLDIELLEKKIEENKVDKTYKTIVEEGFSLEKELSNIELEKSKQKNNISAEEKLIEELNIEKNNLSKEINTIGEEVANLQTKLKEIENIEVLSDEEMNSLSDKIINLDKEIIFAKDIEDNIDKLKSKIKENEKTIKNSDENKKNIQENINMLDIELNKLKEISDKFTIEQMSSSIRNIWMEHFSHGDSCPVCGSKVDNLVESEEVIGEDIEYKEQIIHLEKDREELNAECIKLETIIEYNKKAKIDLEGELKNHENNKGEKSVKSLMTDKDICEKYYEEQKIKKDDKSSKIDALKEKISTEENRIKDLEKESYGKESSINAKEENLETFLKMVEDIESRRYDILDKIEKIKIKSKISSFEEERILIKEKEEILEETQLNKSNKSSELEEIQNEKTKLESEKNSENTQCAILSEKNSTIKKKIDEIEISLKKIMEITDFDDLLNTVYDEKEDTATIINTQNNNISIIDSEVNSYKKLLSDIDIYCNNIAERYGVLKSDLEVANKNVETLDKKIGENKVELNLNEKQSKEYKEVVDLRIKTIGINSVEEVETAYLGENISEEYRVKIKDYNDLMIKIKLKISDIENKLDGNIIEDFTLSEKEDVYKSIEKVLENLRSELTKETYKLGDIEKRLEVVKEIHKELLSKEKEMDSILQLEKLLKGNKFVEYLSQIYLKNIVFDASQRLDQITNGRYSLEIDSNYLFVIRDNFNGGLRRSADTLSGGETFLTSLSLALALSSQIQLKGSAPLEFFFLDEGFGTLDSELLDTVMESLEKLHSKTMSVGIISHVEELKNRIPIKLIVEMDDANSTSVSRIELS
ncbi:AAA family ATPase [Peptostreptococcus faecalis]|uniref:AAA family ATPase n=1 Tax=Peptostreptococcus faecalis TaxID=2045015 RepID=UPI0015E14951|nr:SbcC/MukB-like Walker B domain-containing protein [Peptostreptococcus faecalis]